MNIREQLEKDIIAAMKAREEHKLTTLRMVKSALKSREIDKRAPLDEQETLQTLSTLIKQRRDSVEQFTKGGRQELADKESSEIAIIEAYMPKAADAGEVSEAVKAAIAEMTAAGTAPNIKDMGMVMKAAMGKFQASGARVDGKLVSEEVKKQLAVSS
ncbi:MAG: GatB/YqeY domain-containing protein [Acidobacteriaceae bacterium]